MSIIYVLIPIAILLTLLGLYLFFWAVKTDQFEDLEKQGLSILFEDDKDQPKSNSKNSAAELPTNEQTNPYEQTQASDTEEKR